MIEGKNYIDGKFVDSNVKFSSRSPFDGILVGIFPQSSREDVKQTVSVARKKQKEWRSLSRIARAEYFLPLIKILLNFA